MKCRRVEGTWEWLGSEEVGWEKEGFGLRKRSMVELTESEE